MESQQQPPEMSLPRVTVTPAPQSDAQLQRIGTQVSVFLAQLPNYIGRFFNEYKQPIISIALVVAGLIALRVVLTILVALIDIPLVAPTFKLIGMVYSVWFISRYLLKASTRQELSEELHGLKQQVVGSQQLPESRS